MSIIEIIAIILEVKKEPIKGTQRVVELEVDFDLSVSF